jgi:hypothetical protein
MSSDGKDTKPDSAERAPSSGTSTRLSARAPSVWGAMRDALAALRNLDALLRSSSVLYRTILGLLPELRASSAVLRVAFERARTGEGAGGVVPGADGGPSAEAEVGEYGVARVEELERLLDATAQADEERDDLASRALALADELEASADLLALLERAGDPAPTEVGIDLIVRETVRHSRSGRGQEIVVRFDEASPDCTVQADPYVVGPLLTLVMTAVRAGGVDPLVVRARCDDSAATLVVEQATAEDASRPTLSMRILPPVAPTATAARRAARQIGVDLELEPGRGGLRIPRASG